MNKLTVPGRIFVTLLILGVLWGIKWLVLDSRMVLKKTEISSQEIGKIDLPDAPKNASTAVPQADMPSEKAANLSTPALRWQL